MRFRKPRTVRLDGAIQRVFAKKRRRPMCVERREREKEVLRKRGSGMKRQFTVHLCRNWRVSSKARVR